jgi:branched-chain amino acid transport system substrate-binding protein
MCAAALVLAACGNDDEASGGGGGGGGTLNIGILTALSGPNAVAAADSIRGAQARFDAYEAAGQGCAKDDDFKLVQGDDASSAQGALAGAQKLVQQDDVYAMITVSAFFYGASPFLTTQGKDTPVIGGAWDGAKEWSTVGNNLFHNNVVPDYSTVYSQAGDFLKSQGAKKVAGIAYVSPSSQAGLTNGFASITAAGLQKGYTNDSVQFGSTDVGAMVLGILNDGDDAVYTTINFDTSLALVAGLHQAGWNGIFISPTGYGADLLQSPPAVQAGQGVIFSNAWTPVEQNTPATQAMSAALKQYADNESGIPGYYESQGWLGADLFLYGLEKAGCDASQADLMSTLKTTDDWDANGLYPSPIPQSTQKLDQSCSFYVKLQDSTFVPVGEQPVCGGKISG